MRKIKIFILKILKSLGFFRLALHLTQKKLRIFCYHGFSYDDEHLFMPGLFMHPDTFEHRIKLIKKYEFDIISLDEGHVKIQSNSLKKPSAVITFDDGFISTFDLAIPILKQYNYPSTVYVTSYYQQKQSPIYRLAIQYCFWKTQIEVINLTSLNLPITLTGNKTSIMWELIKYGETKCSDQQRTNLISKIITLLNIELSANLKNRFMLLDSNENIVSAFKSGVDIQLHTHRHSLPRDRDLCLKELQENQQYLQSILGSLRNHFCYPSGIWSDDHIAPLSDFGVETATTCDPGLISPSINPLKYPRFLDSNAKELIEFEADLTGITHYILKLKHFFGIDTRTTY